MFYMPHMPMPEKPPYMIVNDTFAEMIECYLIPKKAPELQDADYLRFAEELKEAFDDGFQLGDLLTVVRVSLEFLEPYGDLSAQQKRDGVIQTLNHFIDITDTPYVPDEITDPMMKALVPPFVDLSISAINGELLEKLTGRYEAKSGTPTQEDIDTFLAGIGSFLQGEFSWDLVLKAVEESVAFCYSYVDLHRDELKDMTYNILAFILDVTPWPYGLDPILDPLTKIVMRPVIDLAFDAI